MTTLQWTTRSEEETARLGAVLAETLSPGTVVALVGSLGAGKTRLVQALCTAWDIPREEVTSPTFLLIQEYAGNRFPVYHFDTYRLRDIDEFLELGAEEYLYGKGVCLIEWADRVEEILPADHLRLEIEILGETTRLFRVTGSGPSSAAVLQRLQCHLAAE